MKQLLKRIARPPYHFIRNNATRFWRWLRSQIVRSLLPEAYGEEVSFFEALRSQSYNDHAYLAKRIRMHTHWVDKTFVLSEKPNKQNTAKQVEAMMQDFKPETESDEITSQWVAEVLKYQTSHQEAVSFPDMLPSEISPDTLSSIIKTRRSIRSYLPKKIETDLLLQILEAGLWAPTGCHRQPVEYLVIDSPEDVLYCQKLAGEYYNFPREASVNLVVLIDPRGYSLPRQRHMTYLEGGAAIQNILLTAHSLGLGSCWMFWAKYEPSFNSRFNLPAWLLPVGLVSLGYTNQQPPIIPKRKSVLDSLYDQRANGSFNNEHSQERDINENI